MVSRQIGWRTRSIACLLFAFGFVADWEALRLCFAAFGLPPDPRVTFVGFGVLYFLSRTPVLPLGIGLVEAGGFALLRVAHISVEQAGALVVVWGFLRVTVPYLLAAGGFLSFLPAREWSVR